MVNLFVTDEHADDKSQSSLSVLDSACVCRYMQKCRSATLYEH
jgi:hypothetical protein